MTKSSIEPQKDFSPNQYKGVLIAVSIFLFGSLLRLWQIEKFMPTADEFYTISLIRLPFWDRFFLTIHDVHPPLFYEYLSLWIHALEFLTHGMPRLALWKAGTVLIDILGILLILTMGARVMGRQTAGWTAALWAVSPVAIGYAQNLRNYQMAVFMTLLLLFSYHGMQQSDGRKKWMYCILTITAGIGLLYTHLIGGLILVALGLAWIAGCVTNIMRRRPLKWMPGFIAFTFILIGFLPWALTLQYQLSSYGAHRRPGLRWAELSDLYRTFCLRIPFGWPPLSDSIALLLCVIWILLVVSLVVMAVKKCDVISEKTSNSEQQFAYLLLWILTFVFLTAWGLSYFQIHRMLDPAIPLLAILSILLLALITTLARIRYPVAGALAAVALFLMMFIVSSNRPLHPAREAYLWSDWKKNLPDDFKELLIPKSSSGEVNFPVIIYPDFWVDIIPAPEGAKCLSFSQWLSSERSSHENAMLIQMIPFMWGFGDEEPPKEQFLMNAAVLAAGYPPKVPHDLQRIEANTIMLTPLDNSSLEQQYDQYVSLIPESEAYTKLTHSVAALDLRQAARQGFYSLESNSKQEFWRWSQGDKCRVTISGPFGPGSYEAVLCIDHPVPQPAEKTNLPIRVYAADSSTLISECSMEVSSSGVQLLRVPFELPSRVIEVSIEFNPQYWIPSQVIQGSGDHRLLGVRFYWAGIEKL